MNRVERRPMPTLAEVLKLANSLRAQDESWRDFTRRCGIKSYDEKQLRRLEAGEFSKGPHRSKLQAFYDELLTCQAKNERARGAEGTSMQDRRQRALEQFRLFIRDLETPDELRAAVRGAMEGVDALHRGRLQGSTSDAAGPPGGHKARR